MTSYELSQSHNLQTVLWGAAYATGRLGRMARQTPQAGLHAALWLYTTLLALWPDLAALCASTAKVTAVALGIIGTVAGLALLMAIPMVLVGLFLTGLFALATMPRKAVRK